jgi:hypothetical protein
LPSGVKVKADFTVNYTNPIAAHPYLPVVKPHVFIVEGT